MADVGSYRFVQAAHYHAGRTKPIRLIVCHDMETGETSKTAENVAAYFADPNSRQASAHFCCDNDSIIRCVHDADVAWQAAGANSDGIGIEHAGRASQTRAQWLDTYSKQMLERSSVLAALLCRAYHIPATHLTVAQVADGRTKGFCSHADVSKAFPKVSTGHTDPGPNFPWDYYLNRVRAHLAAPTPAPSAYHWTRLPLRLGDVNIDVHHAQQRLGISADGIFGQGTLAAVKKFQTAHHLTADGVVGILTASALG